MPQRFDEGRLRFEFGEAWRVVKYDGHPAYRKGIEGLSGTKAVDFVGLLGGSLYLIEVKDFRGYRIANKKRIRNGDLAVEVARKARDSVAGLIGALHTSGEPAEWRPFVRALAKHDNSPRVVLWLEEDRHGPSPVFEKRRKSGASVLIQQLKNSTKWLTTKVVVASRQTRHKEPPSLSVGSLRGAGQTTRKP